MAPGCTHTFWNGVSAHTFYNRVFIHTFWNGVCIHQDLDSISAYLNHTTGVYVHTLTYGDIQNNESMCSYYFFRIKYMHMMIRRMEYAYIRQDLDSISAYLNHTIHSICAYIHVWRYTK